MACENCGTELVVGLKFCTKCGNKVKSQSIKSAITSLVFGILSSGLTLWGVISILSSYQEMKKMMQEFSDFSMGIGFLFIGYIPYIIIITLGLIFGYVSFKNKKTKYAKIGISLSYLSIVFVIIQMILTISIYK